MGMTMLEQSLQSIVCEFSDEWREIINQYHIQLRQGFWTQSYVDCCIQRFDGKLTLEDAYEFAQYHTLLGTKQVARCTIHVGNTPYGDSEVEENNQILSSELPYPFKGEFNPRGGGSDGFIKWSKPIKMVLYEAKTGVKEFITIKPSHISLEVGTVGRGKMLGYLKGFDSRGVARWAYGSNCIEVFYPTSDYLDTIRETW